MTSRIVELARDRSVDLLRACATPYGFVASSRFDHYRSVWARDACIAGLGALASNDPDLIACAGATLDTLAAGMTPLGHVPAVVRPEAEEWDWGEGGVVDSNLWFVILAGRHFAVTGDLDRAGRWWPAVERALRWIAHQDVTGSGLISAAPSTDWMDAALTRSGRTLHLNVLHAWAAREAATTAGRLGRAAPVDPDEIRRRVDTWFWPDPSIDVRSLYPHGFGHDALAVAYWEAASPSRTHYLSHIVHAALIDKVDVLANLLAVVAGVADMVRSTRILDELGSEAYPHPTPALLEAVQPGDPSAMLVSVAEAVIPPRWQNRPGRYHNGGSWPYIGGFHVLAEVSAGRPEHAAGLLEAVAMSNSVDDWAFPEWIDTEGRPRGAAGQAWNAGAYLLGYRALRSAV
jgi:hypothetical protein